MSRLHALTLSLLLTAVALPASAVTLSLYDWGLNINGDIHTPDEFYAGPSPSKPLPAGVDVSGFWFASPPASVGDPPGGSPSGLGRISVVIALPGTHHVTLFLDHEIDEETNTHFNESGSSHGTAATGQSWEIDEPGFLFGDIYSNFLAGSLGGDNGVPALSEDDVSMALAWDFALGDLQKAVIHFLVSKTAPAGGFYLSHTDPNSDYTIYFSSTLRISAIPEPTTVLLLGLGLAGLGLLRRRGTLQS